MSEKIVLFLKIHAKNEFHDQLKNTLIKVAGKALQEKGCSVYSVHESFGEGEKALYLYEVFESQEAYSHYLNQSYTLPLKDSLKEWLAQPIEATRLAILP